MPCHSLRVCTEFSLRLSLRPCDAKKLELLFVMPNRAYEAAHSPDPSAQRLGLGHIDMEALALQPPAQGHLACGGHAQCLPPLAMAVAAACKFSGINKDTASEQMMAGHRAHCGLLDVDVIGAVWT